MVFKKVVYLMMGCLGLSRQSTLPAGSSSVVDEQDCNSCKIRLSDGRLLAYSERGVPKEASNYKVVIVHGFGSSKEMNFMASEVSQLLSLFFV